MKWSLRITGGPERVNHAAVAVDQRIYSFGGYCTGENFEGFTPIDVHVFDTLTLRWRSLPVIGKNDPEADRVPFRRYGHTVVEYLGKVYLWGGRNDKRACNILYCFDVKSHSWSRPAVSGQIPAARDGHSAAILSDGMYIFGGFEEESQTFSCELHRLDLMTFIWTLVKVTTNGSPPKYLDFHTCTALGDCLYVFGGRGDVAGATHTGQGVYDNTMRVFNSVSNQWTSSKSEGDVPLGRRSHSAFERNGHVYIFGGYNAIEKQHFNDLHQYNPAHKRWKKLTPSGEGPCSRRRQTCCVIGNRMFLYGGAMPVPGASPSSDEDDPPNLLDMGDLFILDFSE